MIIALSHINSNITNGKTKTKENKDLLIKMSAEEQLRCLTHLTHKSLNHLSMQSVMRYCGARDGVAFYSSRKHKQTHQLRRKQPCPCATLTRGLTCSDLRLTDKVTKRRDRSHNPVGTQSWPRVQARERTLLPKGAYRHLQLW